MYDFLFTDFSAVKLVFFFETSKEIGKKYVFSPTFRCALFSFANLKLHIVEEFLYLGRIGDA